MGAVVSLKPNLPPANAVESELAVLGNCLNDPELFAAASLELRPEDFYDDANKVLWRLMLEAQREGVELHPVDLCKRLERVHALDMVGGSPAIADLLCVRPERDLTTHVRLVREARVKREIGSFGERIAVESKNGVGNVENWASEQLSALSKLVEPASARTDWPVLTAVELFRPLEPVPYILEPLDLCPGAPALVAGYGYSGKTVAMQSLMLSVASGQPVWGVYKARGGRCLHLDWEQGKRLTSERYQRLAAGMMVTPDELAGRLEVVPMPALYLDQAAAERTLLRRCQGVALCLVDSLRACAPSLDENDSKFRGVLDVMTRVSERTGCCFVVVHHARKPQKDAPGGAKAAIRGTGAIFDACGSVLVFEAEKGGATRVQHEKARTSGRLADDFELHIRDEDTGGVSRGGLIVTAQAREGSSPRRGKRAELERIAVAVLAFVCRQPGAGSRAICANVDGDDHRIRSAIELMLEDGRLRKEPGRNGGTAFFPVEVCGE